METEAVEVSRFTGPIGFEVYTGRVSIDQRVLIIQELSSLVGVDSVHTRTNAPTPHTGYTLRVFVKADADPREVHQRSGEKMKELVLRCGTFPPPALSRY